MLKTSARCARRPRAIPSLPAKIYVRHNTNTPPPSSSPPKSYSYQQPTPPAETRLASYLRRSPRAMSVFESLTGVFGMGSPRQVGGRVTYHYYQDACSNREEEEREFWHKSCHLPPTFQTWFTVTNLHIWMLTVRLRALPTPHGPNYVQGLVDNFFLDVEDRIRHALSKRAPERIITRQMKIFREQWAGLGLACDYALGLSAHPPSTIPGLAKNSESPGVPSIQNGDTELAAAIWRNLLGARGAHGIDDPGVGQVRRAVNIGGSPKFGTPDLSALSKKQKSDKGQADPEEALKKIESTDDKSGVHDFTGADIDEYVRYPEVMARLVAYIRRELVRLDGIDDEAIIRGEGLGKFGPIILERSAE